MDVAWVIARLRAHAGALAALLDGVPEEQARWKPDPDAWSILEVTAHLADEETKDFRARVAGTLTRPEEPWAPIDPPRWAVEERYNERNLAAELQRFLGARAASVGWLEELEAPDWSRSYEHPSLGSLRAGDLLAAWLAHDHIHIRQINRLQRRYAAEVTLAGWSLDYAGRW